MTDVTLELEPQDRVEPATELCPGSAIGHFRVVREIGAGGMGRVFEAHDPDLERRVAIKVVRDPAAGERARERMLREAQAMARLAHPNVVTIHEVGTIGRQIFLVMELVPGKTLATWLEQPRGWRAIVEVFAQAGDGLAAAHAAGLVHRDFKPSNALIDDDGRVRVSDFGLAHLEGDPVTLAMGSQAPPLVGTPAYIAPEQRAGGEVDGRADQYAFGVSLQQALEKVTAPRRVRAAISRALAIEPADRFPEIGELVRELRGALARRARLGLAAAVTAAVAGGAGLAFVLVPTPEHACDAGGELAHEMWNAYRGPVDAGLRAAHTSDDAIATTTRLVDDWVAAWELGRQATCESEPAQRPARVACLDRALGEVRAQLAVWRLADAKVAEHAPIAASRLPDLAACVEPVARTPAPYVTARMSTLRALARSGHAVAARNQLATTLAAVEAVGDPATIAESLVIAGEIELEMGNHRAARDHLARAARSAGTAHDETLMTHALVYAAKVAIDQGRPLDGLGLLDAADAVAAAGHYDRLDRIAVARGHAFAEAGRSDEAVASLERGVALLESRAQRDRAARLELATALVWLANAHQRAFRYERGLPHAERALSIETADLGPAHPQVGQTLHMLGNIQLRLDRHDEAATTYGRARRIFVASYGDQHDTVAGTDVQLATLAVFQGKLDEAREHFKRAQRGLAAVTPDHPMRAAIESGLGSIERDSDRCAEALPHFERAITLLERMGRGGGDLAVQLTNRGACLLYTDRPAEARAVLARAEALLVEAKLDPPQFTEVWMLQAELADLAGKRREAIALVERVLAKTSDADGIQVAALRKYAREQMLAKWKR